MARRSWLANFVQGKKEVAMARDLLTLAALSIMVGLRPHRNRDEYEAAQGK